MLSALPITTALSPIHSFGNPYLKRDQPKNTTPNQMVERQSFFGKVRQLRQAEELLSQPLHQVRSEAKSTDENPPKPFYSSRQFYIIPGTAPNTVSPDFVTDYPSAASDNKTLVEPFAGPLSHELRESLLGKSPLRLVVSREPRLVPPATQPSYWVETLECSHTYTAYQYVEAGDFFCSIPSAKRRRCVECKEAQPVSLPIPPTKVLPVGRWSSRIAEYLFAARDSAIDPWAKDDYHVSAVAVMYAAQGYQKSWNRAFLEYYGTHFHKALVYWLERDAKRDLLGPGLTNESLILPPKKPVQSVREVPDQKVGEI